MGDVPGGVLIIILFKGPLESVVEARVEAESELENCDLATIDQN